MRAAILFALLTTTSCTFEVEETGDDPMVRGSIQDDDFEQRARELERQGKIGQPPKPAPPEARKGGWSGNNQLGNEVGFAPDIENRQTVLKLDEWGMPELWTVSLFINYKSPTDTIIDGFDVKAEIYFGSGGTTQLLVCDWINSNMITLPMNAVNVIAKYNNVSPTEARDLRLGVQLARGSRNSGPPPRLSVIRTFLPPGFSTPLIPMPLFAKRVWVSVSSNAATPLPNYSDITLSLRSSNYLVTSPIQSAVATGTHTYLDVFGMSRFIEVGNIISSTQNYLVNVWVDLDG